MLAVPLVPGIIHRAALKYSSEGAREAEYGVEGMRCPEQPDGAGRVEDAHVEEEDRRFEQSDGQKIEYLGEIEVLEKRSQVVEGERPEISAHAVAAQAVDSEHQHGNAIGVGGQDHPVIPSHSERRGHEFEEHPERDRDAGRRDYDDKRRSEVFRAIAKRHIADLRREVLGNCAVLAA